MTAAGGAQTETASTSIAQANLPNVAFPVSGVTLSNGAVSGTINDGASPGGSNNGFVVGTATATNSISQFGANLTSNVSVSSQGTAASGGSGTAATSAAFSTAQPTGIGNYIIKT